jgi:hypothetical protein
MRFSLLAALAAATALIPAAAIAQHHDRGSWQQGDRGGRGDRGGHAAAPSRPDSGRGDFRSRAPQQARQGQFARPERPAQVHRGNVRQGFDRPNASRPAQVRPDGNWRAQAGGSRADRPDRNDWNRDRSAQWRQNGNRDRGHQWTGDRNDRDHRWNSDRDRGQRWDGHRSDRDHRWDGNRDRGHQWDRSRNDHGRFDRGWRHDNRYDWHNYRARHRTVYRLPRYYAPYGWDYGYRRFGVGFRLNSILFGSSYWISDPYYYRLPPAYGPYRWVRYYNDALLVDIDTGTVVDVVYDIFW